jgi:hypothetical protein
LVGKEEWDGSAAGVTRKLLNPELAPRVCPRGLVADGEDEDSDRSKYCEGAEASVLTC